jgi:transcriptional antiterminator RfaH
MSYWAVCQCMSRREQAVVDRLHRIGYTTYLPKLKSKTRIDALFPGYLFVQIESAFYPVRWTVGVIGLRMTYDQRGLEAIMTETRKLERGGYIPATTATFRRGQQLRVTGGSFAGQIGLCGGLRGEDRTLVFLDLFGRMTQVELPNRDVAPMDVVAPPRRF